MLILDLIVSGFAAWGIFCAAKFLADGFMTPKDSRPRPMVRLRGSEDIGEIVSLCENARKAIVCNRGEILLLLPEDNAFSRELERELEGLKLSDVKIVYEKGKAENER